MHSFLPTDTAAHHYECACGKTTSLYLASFEADSEEECPSPATEIADGTVSEMMVLHSPAGYFIGHEVYKGEVGCWFPHSRVSQNYFKTRDQAQTALDTGYFLSRSV